MQLGKLYINCNDIKNKIIKNIDIAQYTPKLTEYYYYCEEGIFKIIKNDIIKQEIYESKLVDFKNSMFVFDLSNYNNAEHLKYIPPNGVHVCKKIYEVDIGEVNITIEDETFMHTYPKLETNINLYVNCTENDIEYYINHIIKHFKINVKSS